MATGADWLKRLRAHIADQSGDLLAGEEYDRDTCDFSPDDLVGFFNAGREEFCLRRPIYQSTGDLALVTVDGAGDGRVTLGAPVLWVERVLVAGVPLPRTDTAAMDDYFPARPGDSDPWELRTGTPKAYLIEDGQPLVLRLWPAPTTDTAVALRIRRGPKTPLTLGTLNAELADALSERDGQAVLWWAASLAFQRPDSSTYSEALVAANAARFEAAVGPRPDPAELAFRQRTAGRPPLRTRTYRR